MSDWSPPENDLAPGVNMGEGLDRAGPMRVSAATQAARDQAAALLRATYEPEGDPSGLGNVERIIQANAGGKSKLAASLRNWVPPEAQVQQVAFKPPEADLQQPTIGDQLLQPWKGETVGSMVSQNAGVRLFNYAKNIGYFQSEIAQENPDAGPLETFRLAAQRYKEKIGQAPETEINWSDLPKGIYDQVTKAPWAFVSNLAKSLVVDPEMALMVGTKVPSALAAAGRPVAAAAVRAGEVGAQLGAQSAGISAAEQLEKTGDVRAQPIEQAAVSGVAMGTALGVAHSAMRAGLESVSVKNGAKVTPAVEAEAAQRFDAKVAEGATPDEALSQILREAGMGEPEAQRMGAALSPANDALEQAMRTLDQEKANATGEGIKPQGDVAEHPNGDQVRQAAEAGGGDSLQRGGQEPEAPRVESGQVISLADARQRAITKGAMDRADRQELDATLNDAQRYIDQGRLTDARVVEALDEGGLDGLSELLTSIEAPQMGQQRLRSVQEMVADVDRASSAKVSGELRRLQDYQRRVETEVEGLTGDAKYEALRDAARQISDLQIGRSDPKMLALLALPGVGAAAGYWIGTNSADKVRDALLGAGVSAAALILGKVRGAVTRVADAISDKRYNPVEMFDQYQTDLRLGRLTGYQAEQNMKAMVGNTNPARGLITNPIRESAMTHSLEAGDTASLSPAEQKAVQFGSDIMRKWRDSAEGIGVEMGQIIDNYATHAYVRGLNSKEGLVENLMNVLHDQSRTGGGMSPKSRWAMQRVIPTLALAKERGLIPVTERFPEIVRMYVDTVSRTMANHKFLEAISKHKLPSGEPLVVKADDLKAEIKRRTNERLGQQSDEIGPAAAHLDADIAQIKSPHDYVFINHPQLRNVLVHRDVAPPLRALMDATEPIAIERAVHGAAVAAKSAVFSGSLFHAKSLVDAGMGAGLGSFKRGAMAKIKDPSNGLVREAVASGLNIVDRPLEAEIAPIRNMMKLVEAKLPFGTGTPIKALRVTQDGMNKFLWGYVHPTLKFNVWSSVFERALTDPSFLQKMGQKLRIAPDWSGLSREQIAKLATSYTNDIFGGINWFDIANNTNSKYLRDLGLAFASPRGRRLMQIIALAPDWTVATARSMYKAIPGLSEPQVAALHRQYLLRQALVYLTLYNGVNNALSGHNIWENRDPTMLDAGDGRRIQMAKHTMEPIHWLTQPGQQLWNKLGYPVKEPILQMFGKDYLSLKGGDVGGPPIGNRALHALKSATPIPLTTLANQGPGTALSGMFGVPIYGKTEQQAVDAAIERALNLGREREEAAAQRARERGQDEDKARARSRAYNSPEAARRRVEKQYENQRREQEYRRTH